MRYYSNTAVATTLTASITASDVTIQIASVAGLPSSFPFTLVLDPDTVSVEIVTVTALAGSTATVTRGQDNTTAVSHNLGAAVLHAHSARDFKESRDHEAATSGVHGIAGTLVGTTDTQTLTNKNLAGAGNTFPATLLTAGVAATLTNKDLTSATNTFPTSLVTLTGSQTLTGKTLTSPTITSPTVTSAVITGLTLDTENLSTAWTAYTPSFTSGGVGNGTITGAKKKIGKTGFFRITLTWGSTTFTTGAMVFSVPYTAATSDIALPVGRATCKSTSLANPRNRTAVLTAAGLKLFDEGGNAVDNADPFTWGNGDVLEIVGFYEIA